MAAGQLPRHDFAPAWLKLPNNEHSSWKQGTNDRLFYPSSGNGRLVGRHGRMNSGPQRGGSGIIYDDMVAQQQSFHHQQPFGRPRFYSNEYYEDYDMPFNGIGPRVTSRPGPNSARSHMVMNGTFMEPPYHGYNGHRATPLMTNDSTKKPHRAKETRTLSTTSSVPTQKSDSPKTTTTPSSLDDEFPSLNGDTGVENSKLTASKVSTVWDSPNRQSRNIGRSSSLNADSASHKALVLKTGNAKRLSSQPGSNRSADGKEGMSNGPAEGLSSCLVTQPKNVQGKKSNFLRSLRNNESDSQQQIDLSEPNNDNSNCNDSTDTDDRLSASYEDEQRLLREMGWKDDDEQYEITEQDVAEFQNLCRQLQVSIPSYKKRNGFTKFPAGHSLSFPVFINNVPLPKLDSDCDSASSTSSSCDEDDDKAPS
jgi:hypothetical protein